MSWKTYYFGMEDIKDHETILLSIIHLKTVQSNIWHARIKFPNIWWVMQSAKTVMEYFVLGPTNLSRLAPRIFIPIELTQRDLADTIRVPHQRINDIVNGRRSITPSTALRLAKFFNMSADFWMNVQLRWDMYFAQQDETTILKTIQPLQPSHTA